MYIGNIIAFPFPPPIRKADIIYSRYYVDIHVFTYLYANSENIKYFNKMLISYIKLDLLLQRLVGDRLFYRLCAATVLSLVMSSQLFFLLFIMERVGIYVEMNGDVLRHDVSDSYIHFPTLAVCSVFGFNIFKHESRISNLHLCSHENTCCTNCSTYNLMQPCMV